MLVSFWQTLSTWHLSNFLPNRDELAKENTSFEGGLLETLNFFSASLFHLELF